MRVGSHLQGAIARFTTPRDATATRHDLVTELGSIAQRCGASQPAGATRCTKSRRRDPLAVDYDTWQLIRVATGEVVASGSIDDVETALDTYRPNK